MAEEQQIEIEVKRITEDVSPVLVAAREYRIVDESSMEGAVNFLGKIKSSLDRVEQTRKFFTAPLLKIKKEFDAKFAPVSTSLEEAEAALKGEMRRYRETLPKEELPRPSTTKTADAKVTFVRKWKFEITDPAAVPREYLTVDSVKIGKVVDAGIRTIPGVRVYETEEVRGSYA